MRGLPSIRRSFRTLQSLHTWFLNSSKPLQRLGAGLVIMRMWNNTGYKGKSTLVDVPNGGMKHLMSIFPVECISIIRSKETSRSSFTVYWQIRFPIIDVVCGVEKTLVDDLPALLRRKQAKIDASSHFQLIGRCFRWVLDLQSI